MPPTLFSEATRSMLSSARMRRCAASASCMSASAWRIAALELHVAAQVGDVGPLLLPVGAEVARQPGGLGQQVQRLVDASLAWMAVARSVTSCTRSMSRSGYASLAGDDRRAEGRLGLPIAAQVVQADGQHAAHLGPGREVARVSAASA